MDEQQDSFFSHFKAQLFSFTNELVTNQIAVPLYVLFLIVESLQYIGYHNNGLIKYHTLGFSQLAVLTQWLNPLVPLQTYSINRYMVIIFTVLTLLHLILIVIGFRTYHSKIAKMANSVQQRNLHKNRIEYFINLLMVCFNTFLTIPIFQSSLVAIYCNEKSPFVANNDCYSGQGVTVMVLAVINMLWLLITNVYYSLYYYGRNPFCHNILTCSSNWWNLGKFTIKITPMAYFAYDPQLNFPILFLIIIAAAHAGYLAVFRFLFPYYRYNFQLQQIVFFIQVYTCLLGSSFVLIFFKQDLNLQQNALLLCWIIMSALLSLVILRLFRQGKLGLLGDIHSLQKNKLEGVLQYLVYLIYATQRSFNEGKNIFYLGNLAKTHRFKCQNAQCYCRQWGPNVDCNRDKHMFYALLMGIIDRVIAQNRKAYPFYTLKAYILFYKMESHIKAATTISIIMANKLDFSNQMLVNGLLFELDRQYVDTRDMQVYRKFNQYLLRQEDESQRLVDLYLQYWAELTDQQSSIPKLRGILTRIKQSKQELQGIVDNALKIFRNHVRVLFLYKRLLKDVLNDYLGYIRCEQKYKLGQKESKLTNVDAGNTIQFRPNQSLLVINLTRQYSTNTEQLGNYKIISISSNVRQFLGYVNTQLRDQSINKLLPRIYHQLHDTFLDRVLDKPDKELTSRQIRVFPINNQGQLVQCNLISKYMPSITHGINIVSFLEECDKYRDQFFIIYDGKTGIVDCMNMEAEAILKQGKGRKMKDILSIPDHINDLLPNWDFRAEVWRSHVKTQKQVEESQILCDMKDIQVIRSDVGEKSTIKVLKFKGDYFLQMFSLDNQNFQQSQTIQQYLQLRKGQQESPDSSKVESAALQNNKAASQGYLSQRKTKTESKKKIPESQLASMQPSMSSSSKRAFTIVQILLMIGALAAVGYLMALSHISLARYQEDLELQMHISNIQNQLSEYSYSLARLLVAIFYTTPNASLPFQNYVVSHDSQIYKNATISNISSTSSILKVLNPKLIEKVKTGQISAKSIQLSVLYLADAGGSSSYEKSMDVTHAVFQSNDYTLTLLDCISTPQNWQQVIESPEYFYLMSNTIYRIPDTLNSLQSAFLESINIILANLITFFMAIAGITLSLIVLATIVILGYYRYIYSSFIWPVLRFYESIKVENIKGYQIKCNSYKKDMAQQDYDMEEIEPQPVIVSQAIIPLPPQTEKVDPSSQIELNQSCDEEAKLINSQQQSPQIEQRLNFESFPSLLGVGFRIGFCLVLFVLAGVFLCMMATNSAGKLNANIQKLVLYNIIHHSVVQLRYLSQTSLNMFDYWQPYQINSTFPRHLEKYFQHTVRLLNDSQLELDPIRPVFSAKINQFRLVQNLTIAQDHHQLQASLVHIDQQLADMSELLQFLQKQSVDWANVVKSESQSMGSVLKILISAILVLLVMFWGCCIRHYYINLLEQQEVTYQMYNMIGYNLRKQLQAQKQQIKPKNEEYST